MSGGLSRHSIRTGCRSSSRARRSAVAAADLTQRLAALETAVANLAQKQAENAPALTEAVDRLDKQLARAGREQFKATALAETQQKSTEAVLEQLRDAAAYREREMAQLRERLAEAGDAGRLDVVQRLFPALDGLAEALASGRRLQQRATEHSQEHLSFWQRLNPARRAALAAETSSKQAVAAWLEGLAFVQERLLEALAAVGVVPLITEGSRFDPHRHVAVETAPATEQAAAGQIVREHRRGYVHGDTVLRYAEVVVARASMEDSNGGLNREDSR